MISLSAHNYMEFFCLRSVLFVLLSIFLYLYFNSSNNNKKSNHSTKTNGFKSYPVVGSLPGFLKNGHRHLDWMADTLSRCTNNTAHLRRLGNNHGIMTASPSTVEHILKSNFDNYCKGSRFISFLQDLFGQGVFVSNHGWKPHRKTIASALNPGFLKTHVTDNIIESETRTRLLPVLDRAADSGTVIDLQDVLDRFTFDNVCKLTFNIDPGCLGGDGRLMAGFKEAEKLIAARLWYPLPWIWMLKRLLNIGSERRLRELIATSREFVNGIIQQRLDQEYTLAPVEDLLSHFIRNYKNNNNNKDDQNSLKFLRDMMVGLVLAGADTTSVALTWFFWIMSNRPDVEKKILDEIEQNRVRSGKSPGDKFGFDELREMDYLHAAITESMRLYPPVSVNARKCVKDDVLPDGTVVPKDSFVAYYAYAMGRMESVWGMDCLEFRPERWLEDGVFRQESPFRYPVFHGGPRMCLGKDIAYLQMKSVAATVIERYLLISAAGDEESSCPKQSMGFTLRMKHGLRVNLTKRK